MSATDVDENGVEDTDVDCDTNMTEDTAVDDNGEVEDRIVLEPHDSDGDDTVSSSENSTDDERTTIEPTFYMDDVHAQAVDELRQMGAEVDDLVAQQLHQAVEQCVYEMRQEAKYGGQQQNGR